MLSNRTTENPVRYGYQLGLWSTDELRINFEGFNDNAYGKSNYGKSTPAVVAMQKVLNSLNLKEGAGYETKESGYGSENQLSSIYIKGSWNCFVVLGVLMQETQNKKLGFDLVPSTMALIYSDSGHSIFQNAWVHCMYDVGVYSHKIIASWLNNMKSWSKEEAERLTPVIRASLDALLQQLSAQDNLVKNLKEKLVESDNLLCHPLFQTLSILMDECEKRESEHIKCKSAFFDKKEKFRKKDYIRVYETCLNIVPNCYCDNNESSSSYARSLNQAKLRQSKPAATINNSMNCNSKK